MNATELERAIYSQIIGALGDGTINPDTTRQIIVGPNAQLDLLMFWSNNGWESYGEMTDGHAFAGVSLANWAAQLDAIEAAATAESSNADTPAVTPVLSRARRALPHALSPSLAAAVDAQLVALRANLQQALRAVATRAPLCERSPQQLLALCSWGLNPSGYADVVAFCHPHGAALLPMRERRGRETSSTYGYGALVPEGITLFYPEGDMPDGQGERSARTFAFEDMAYTSFSRRRDRAVLRMKDELFDIELTHGHTHEEWGDPSAEEVDAAIRAHIDTRPELAFHSDRYPDPANGAAVKRWVDLYRAANATAGVAVVEHIAVHHGVEHVPAFLAVQPEDAADRARTLGEYGEQLMRAGKTQAALDVFAALEGRTRRTMTRYEARCLLTLGRFDDCLALIDATLEGEADDVHYEPSFLPFRAMAQAGAGQTSEAVESMRAVVDGRETGREHGPCWYALAYALQHDDPAAAEEAAYRALRHGSLYVIQAPDVDFADCDAARDAFAMRARLDAQRRDHGDGIERIAVALPAEAPAEPTAEASYAWKLVAHVPLDATPRKLLLADGGRAYLPCKSDGLAVIDLSDPRTPRVERTIESTTSYEGGVLAGQHLYVADWSHGIRTFDLADPAAPRDLGCARRVHDNSGSELAVGGDVLALCTSSGVELFDISDPAHPRLASNVGIGPGYANDVAIRDGHLFIAAGKAGLVVADVRDCAAPTIAAAVRRDALSAERVSVDGDLAFVTDGSVTWLLDVSDPTHPVSLSVVGGDFDSADVLRDGEGYWLARDHARVALLARDASGQWASEQIALRVLPSPEDDEPDVDDIDDARRLGDYLVTAGNCALSVFERETRAVDVAQAEHGAGDVAAFEQAIGSWLDARMAEVESPLGSVKLGYYPGTVYCQWDVPKRYVALGSFVSWHFETVELGELLEGQDERAARLERALDDDAVGPVLMRCVRRLGDSDVFRQAASGRVHLMIEVDSRPQVVETIVSPDAPWIPHSNPEKVRKPPTIEDLLRSDQWYEKAREIIDRARKSPEDRALLFQLGAQGLWSALRVVSPLRAEYEDDVVAMFIAATRSEAGDDRAVSYLADYVARADARARLEEIFEAGTDGAKVIAAAALERYDEPAVFAICERRLVEEDGDEEALELALGTIRERVSELEPALLAWVERNADYSHRVSAIAPHLFRAGHANPPACLVQAAQREIRQSEQYHGSAPMFGEDWEQDASAKAYRLWTGRALATHVLTVRSADSATQSLWPAGQELEPHPASWLYLLESAWSHLEAAGAVQWFVDALCERARPGDDYAGDRAMLAAVSHRLLLGLQFEAAHRVSRAIYDAADAVFDDAVRKKARRRYRTARLAMAFEVLKARKLEAARELSNIMLADQPDDGQVLFYDARLIWLETSVEACLQVIPGYLARVSPSDTAGRGRLLNLHGCALDELKRFAEALPLFEKAVQTEPRELSYVANVAEIHDKLGNADKALAYAKRALAGGHSSPVVLRIAGSAKT